MVVILSSCLHSLFGDDAFLQVQVQCMVVMPFFKFIINVWWWCLSSSSCSVYGGYAFLLAHVHCMVMMPLFKFIFSVQWLNLFSSSSSVYVGDAFQFQVQCMGVMPFLMITFYVFWWCRAYVQLIHFLIVSTYICYKLIYYWY